MPNKATMLHRLKNSCHKNASFGCWFVLAVTLLLFSKVEGKWSPSSGGRLAHDVLSRKQQRFHHPSAATSHSNKDRLERNTKKWGVVGRNSKETNDNGHGAAAVAARNKKDDGRTIFPVDQLRGGAAGPSTARVGKSMETVSNLVLFLGGVIVPPIVITARAVVAFYRTLPTDAIVAQAGLLYCFAGGYYPTLFASVQAARQCGWKQAVQAINALADEANLAIDAAFAETKEEFKNARELMREKTLLVLRTIDPIKINEAAAALYTTWIGIEAVLSKEFASTISMTLTLGDYIYPVADFAIGNPLRMCMPEDYHKWVPILVGWTTKSIAMAVAWRIQRGLSACTSSMAGGFIFSRAVVRLMHRRGIRLGGLIRENTDETVVDDMLGVLVAGLGLYSQLERGFKTGFSFKVPYPLNLLTWPFDIAEQWIQFQITKEPDE